MAPEVGRPARVGLAATPIGIATLVIWFLVGRWQAIAFFLIVYALVFIAGELVRRRMPPEDRYRYLAKTESSDPDSSQ